MRKMIFLAAMVMLALTALVTSAYAQEPNPVCGDGVCEVDENSTNCAIDCTPPGTTPDSPFYIFDKFAEQLQLTGLNVTERISALIQFAAERLAELRAMVQTQNWAAAQAALDEFSNTRQAIAAEMEAAILAFPQNATQIEAQVKNATQAQIDQLNQTLAIVPAEITSLRNAIQQEINILSQISIPDAIITEIEKFVQASNVRGIIRNETANLMPRLNVSHERLRIIIDIIKEAKEQLINETEILIDETNVTQIKERIGQVATELNTTGDGDLTGQIRAEVKAALIDLGAALTARMQEEIANMSLDPETKEQAINVTIKIEALVISQVDALINQSNISSTLDQIAADLAAGLVLEEISESEVKGFMRGILEILIQIEKYVITELEILLDKTPPGISDILIAPDPATVGPVNISFFVNESLAAAPLVEVGNGTANFVSAAGQDCAPTPLPYEIVWGLDVRRNTPQQHASFLNVEKEFEKAVELGVSYIKTGFWWSRIEPQRGVFDQGALNHYKDYMTAAKAHELEVMAILGAPTPQDLGMPAWAAELYLTNKSAFFAEFKQYAAKVAAEFGDDVYYYQIWNEPNVFKWVLPEDSVELINAGHAGVASADGDFETIVNFGFNGRDDSEVEFYIPKLPTIDIIGLDYYPGTWISWAMYEDWTVMKTLFDLGIAYNKKVAITEFGYHTLGGLFTEKNQETFVNRAIPSIREQLKDPAVTRGQTILFAVWHELIDADTASSHFEDRWGVLRSDFTEKPAFNDLGYQMRQPLALGQAQAQGTGENCSYLYSYQVTADAPQGRTSVTITAIDLAGNAAAADSSFVVDTTSPGIINMTIDPKNISAGNNVTIEFDVSEALKETPSVSVNNKSAQFVAADGLHYTFLYNVTEADELGNATVFITVVDLAGNVGNATSQFLIVGKDTDGDGVYDRLDACPTTPGYADRQGCPVGDENWVELHIIDQAKSGACGGAGSCKLPVEGALVRVFDRNDADFQALWGKNPKGTQYPDVFNADVGRVGTCTTQANGRCAAGEEVVGDYLVIASFVDTQTGATAYTGRPKSPEDFVDTDGDAVRDLAIKDFQAIKVIKKDGSIDFKAGSKTVVTGSMLEVVYPQYTLWDNTNSSYPFIFTSDANWTVDVCLYVPAGYNIVGVYDVAGNLVSTASCAQTFVSGETKVVLFEVTATSSPEPNMNASIKALGPAQELQIVELEIPGEVVKEEVPFPILLLVVAIAAVSLVAFVAIKVGRARRMKIVPRLPEFSVPTPEPEGFEEPE